MLSRGWPLALALAWLVAADTSHAGAAAGPFIVDRWEDDLPQNSVIALTQTRDGYLWLGTLGGLVRFDGLRFAVFDEGNTPELNSSRIVRLFEDSRGRLWIGTLNGGIAVLANGQIKSTGLGRDGQLAGACEDSTGAVWLQNSDGQLWRVREGVTNRFLFASEHYSVDRVSPVGRAIIAEPGGRVWVSADVRLASFRPAAQMPGEVPPDWLETPLTNRVDALIASRDGGFWRLSGGQIQKWIGGRLERELGNHYPWRTAPVSAACEDAQGNLIVGTLGEGVFWFDAAGRATALSTNNGLSYNFILSLHLDREGGVWVGTDGGGLNRVKRRLFHVLEPTGGKVVQSVCVGTNGAVWMGFNTYTRSESGAGVVQDGMFRGFGHANGLPFLAVRSVLIRPDGGVWAGTVGGVYSIRSDEAAPPHIRAEVALSGVQVLHEDRLGRVWVGAAAGLASWDGRELRAWPALNAVSVRAIADDARGNVWVGTEKGGLIRLHADEAEKFRRSEAGLPSDHVTALWMDAQGVLWIGTDGGGLARFHEGRWTRYSTREGLAGNAISYLLEDDLNHMWIGSSAGLMRVPKQEMNDFAAGRIPSVNCRAYGREDGLPTKECSRGSQPAAWRARDGRLWFATIQGLVSVDPRQLHPNTIAPPVVIEAVRIEGQTAGEYRWPGSPARAVTVPARKQRIEIQYTSLNLAAPKRARFRYRLEEHEGGWTDMGDSRTVNFKLEPGRYRFQVTACNEDGLWNTVPAEVAIIVPPPFWRTWWFLSLSAAGLLGGVIAVVHFVSTQRLNRQLETLRQQEALERERARIARDIHDQLGANLTQVALLGELVEADRHSPSDIEEHARQISQTARETTRSLDEIVWTVNPANDTLEGLANYLCKYAQEYLAVAGLRCRLEVPAQLPAAPITPEIRHNVFLAAREAVTNIVRHARASSAWLRLKLEPGRFTFELEDDGRGPGDIDSERARTRNGLRNMAKRMEDVGGSFSIGPAAGRGTVVRMTAPIGPRRP